MVLLVAPFGKVLRANSARGTMPKDWQGLITSTFDSCPAPRVVCISTGNALTLSGGKVQLWCAKSSGSLPLGVMALRSAEAKPVILPGAAKEGRSGCAGQGRAQ